MPEPGDGAGGHSGRGLTVLLGALGICAAALVWQALARVLPQDPVPSMAARAGAATAWLIPTALVLLTIVLVQGAARLISGKTEARLGRDGPLLLAGQFAIADTVEQMAIFLPCYLALAAGAPPGWMARVMALGGVFAAARLTVWLGGLLAPVARAPGRAAGLAVCTATAGAALWSWL